MSKTQAERASEYRRRKRDGERDENVTEKRDVTERDGASVTSSECAAILRKSMTPTFADLPLDVQQTIDHMCAENHSGHRQASHSKQAMTERALHYQCMHPSPHGRGVSIARPVVVGV